MKRHYMTTKYCELLLRLSHRQIEAFRAVFETNSMTAAATVIGVTQQAVSRLIRDLEAETNLLLFDRQNRRLLATTDAVALYREVRRSFYGLDRITRAAQLIRLKRPGVLRIAASGAPSHYLLPKIIKRFRSDWPGVRISLNVLPSSEVLNNVSLQQDDLGIADVPSSAPGVDIEPLPSLQFVCVLPREHPLARKRVIKPKDLRDTSLMLSSRTTHQHQRIMAALDFERVIPNIVFEASNSGPIRALVAEDFGVAILDQITAKAYSGQDIAIREFSPTIEYELKLIYPANRARHDRVQAFSELVHQEIELL